MKKEIDITKIVEEMGLQGKDVNELAESEDFLKAIIDVMLEENPDIFGHNVEDRMMNIFAMQCIISTLDLCYLYLLGDVLEDEEYRKEICGVHIIDDIKTSFLKSKVEYKQGLVNIENVKYKAYIYLLTEKTEYEILKDNGLERLEEILENTLVDYQNKIVDILDNGSDEEKETGYIKSRLDSFMLESLTENINKYGIVTEQEVQALLEQEFETEVKTMRNNAIFIEGVDKGWYSVRVELDNGETYSLDNDCPDTSYNRTALYAIRDCLRYFENGSTIELHTGEIEMCYITDVLCKGYIYKWEKNNWQTMQGETVKNEDLLRSILEIMCEKNIEFIYPRKSPKLYDFENLF